MVEGLFTFVDCIMRRYHVVLMVGAVIFSIIFLESLAFQGLPPTRNHRAVTLMAINSQQDSYSEYVDDETLFESLLSTKGTKFEGAGVPRLDLGPEEIPPLLMTALKFNNVPHVDAGLESMWAFAGETTRHVFQKNITDFIESAHQTANQFPTSFYGAAMNGMSWSLEMELNRVGGDDGWIATQVIKTISSDGRLRRWQWELRKNRRPPDLGYWFVESIGSSDRKGQFEPE